MRRRRSILLLIVILGILQGCTVSSESKKLYSKSEEIEQTPKEGEIKMEYTTEEIHLIKNLLKCEEKKAVSILRGINRNNICGIQDAQLVDSLNGYQVEILDSKEERYVLKLDKKMHMYAIQKGDREGEYIYREIE